MNHYIIENAEWTIVGGSDNIVTHDLSVGGD